MRILPEDRRFFEILDRAGTNLREVGRALREDLKPGADPDALARRIRDLEERGDAITHEMVAGLNRTFVTPLDREDLALLSKRIDDVLDRIWDAVARMRAYAVTEIPPSAPRFAAFIDEQTDLLQRALRCLEKRSRMQEALPLVREVHRVEHAADDLLWEVLASAHPPGQSTADLVRALQWKEIHEFLERATDRAEDVGDVIEAVVLKYA